MLKEVKETIECDILGNDEEYINYLNYTDKDYYNIRSMMEAIRSNLTSEYYDKLALACAIYVYTTDKVDVDKNYLREDLNQHIDDMLKPQYDEALYELKRLKKEDQYGEEECS